MCYDTKHQLEQTATERERETNTLSLKQCFTSLVICVCAMCVLPASPIGYPRAKSLLCVAKMAYRPALLYLFSGPATISVRTHTSTNTVTCTQDESQDVFNTKQIHKNLKSVHKSREAQKEANLRDQDAPEKRPDDVSEVQQHHVLKEQSWKSKLRHKVPQTLRLVLRDDIGPVRRNGRNSLMHRYQQLLNIHLCSLQYVPP